MLIHARHHTTGFTSVISPIHSSPIDWVLLLFPSLSKQRSSDFFQSQTNHWWRQNLNLVSLTHTRAWDLECWVWKPKCFEMTVGSGEQYTLWEMKIHEQESPAQTGFATEDWMGLLWEDGGVQMASVMKDTVKSKGWRRKRIVIWMSLRCQC